MTQKILLVILRVKFGYLFLGEIYQELGVKTFVKL